MMNRARIFLISGLLASAICAPAWSAEPATSAGKDGKASALGEVARPMAPGTFAELKTTNALGTFVFGVGTVFAFSNGGAWDPITRQMLQVGAPHGSKMKFVRYQESDNTWYADASMPFGSDGWVGAHTYDHLTIDPKGVFYHIYWNDGITYRYDAPAGKWLDPLPKTFGSYGALHYFPELDGLLRISRGNISLFRLGARATGAWENITPTVPMDHGYENLAAYCPAGKFVMYGGGTDKPRALYKIDTNLVVTVLNPAPFDVRINTGNLTADPVTGTLLYMNKDAIYAYNAAKDKWYPVARNPLSTSEQGIIPISTYGVLAICSSASTPVLLYKFADNPRVMQPCVKSTLKPESDTLKDWVPTRIKLQALLPDSTTDASNTGVQFLGGDTNIAIVTDDGRVVPVFGTKGGEIRVTATRFGEPVDATCRIRVEPLKEKEVVYLSDLTWASATAGYTAPIQKDKSYSGGPISLQGHTYPKGIGTHAPSEIVYKLNKQYEQFMCDVGASFGAGTVTFAVYTDNLKKHESGVLTRKHLPERICIDVRGVETLKLVVGDGGDGHDCDHAVWANAMVLKPSK